MTTLLTLLIKALLPRFLFLLHGVFCIWLVVELENDPRFWYLTICLGLLVIEGILNAVYRKGRELDWVCPSAFLYCIVVITVLVAYRAKAVDCILTKPADDPCSTRMKGTNKIIQALNGFSDNARASIIEQTALLVLIVGRWLLPKGSISREQFSQILLIYVGTAADIVEFSEIYGEDDVKKLTNDRKTIYSGVMLVWGWSVLQFSLTIALPEQGLKNEDPDEENNEDKLMALKWRQTNRVVPMTYMHYKSLIRQGWDAGKNEENDKKKNTKLDRGRHDEWKSKYYNKYTESLSNDGNNNKRNSHDSGDSETEASGCSIKKRDLKNCFYKHLELISCLIPVVMQDGPFFIFRVILVAHFGVVTEMIILLTCKNALVVIVQIYRILIIYCIEPKEKEPDMEDPSIRVRTAMGASSHIRRSLGVSRGSIAIHAISRMQAQILQRKHDQAKDGPATVIKEPV